ncbi:hypothetical protein PANT_14d00085 [Moesziomyces antarcticus T-34]|uniref:Uncharacterized protein n=1 Tax=Pseudozyma antarctica (strain T-34) TaxID=1151754 RepID=M9LQZ7_PSEA3|nr:hypothetical protein PANT_14d00085 [Moesziomyces antarcticus T-34]
MSRRGYGSNWHGSHNPNMAPLPPRPRGGIGSSSSSHVPPAYGQTAPPSHSAYGSPHTHASPFAGSHSPASESNGGAASSSTPEVATTLFVGSISPGISDSWLTRLLEACGHLRSLKRASKAFGFAEYADPDSVLRAIHVLQGLQLPSMGAEASAPPKKLVVKADERTKRFLDKYQHTRVASASDRANDDRALAAVRHVVRNMSDPNAEVEVDPSRPGYVVPDHLKDLPPEELPEDQRATVLSEIEQFRLAAAARDAETRRREAEFERQRAVERARRADLQASSSRNGEDAQSYRKPVDFHAASSYDAQADIVREPEDADQVAEDERRERAQAAARAAASDAERAYLVRERQRLTHWQKEADRQAAEAERWERDAASQLRRWTDWSDETATRKELFYTDRPRWRQFRAPARRREQEADARDRELEQDEKARAQHESETFLAQQAADMARLTQQQRAAGVLVDSSLAPIKITFTGTEAAPSATGSAVKVLGEEEDEQTKRGLKHIHLGESLSARERAEKLAAIAAGLPSDTAELLAQTPGWEWIDAAMVRKYRSWVDAQIEESLGEKVDELVNVVVETIQSHASASALVEVVEPVLDDEAEAFVEKLWRMLLVDSQAAAAGILTS